MTGLDRSVAGDGRHRQIALLDIDGGIGAGIDIAGAFHDHTVTRGDVSGTGGGVDQGVIVHIDRAGSGGHGRGAGISVDLAVIAHRQVGADVHGRVMATGDRRGAIGS